jgi:hypothetical protein
MILNCYKERKWQKKYLKKKWWVFSKLEINILIYESKKLKETWNKNKKKRNPSTMYDNTDIKKEKQQQKYN